VQNGFSSKLINRALLLLALFSILYIIIRAALLDVTHDEAYSFHNARQFWYAEAMCTGNTHWINWLAIKAVIALGLESNFQIRWFSVLSGIVFISIAWVWIKSFTPSYLKLLAGILIFFNPYVLDYFSLARGYAGGLMFEMLAMLLFVLSIGKSNRRLAFFALVCAGLSAVSNYSFIYFFAGFASLHFFRFYFRERPAFLKNKSFYIDILYVAGITLLIWRAFVFLKECSNDVIGAGTPNFTEIFYVASDTWINNKYVTRADELPYFSVAIFILATIAGVYGILKRRSHNQLYFYSSFVLMAMFGFVFLNHFCFGMVFPWYRSALMFFPLLIAVFIYFFDSIVKEGGVKKIIAFSLSAVFITAFVLRMNFTHTFDFWEQADTKKSFDLLQSLNAEKAGISPELYGVFINYHQMTEKYKYGFAGERIETNSPIGVSQVKNKLAAYDYLVLFPPYDLSYYPDTKARFLPVTLFPVTGALVLKVIN